MADGNYIIMLRESLEKKNEILDIIIRENEKQLDILNDANADPDDLDDNIEKKAALVEKLVELDNGFDLLFKNVESILRANRNQYKGEIALMKSLIEQITDKSAKISAQEKVNFEAAKHRFLDVKNQIKKVRQSQQAVNTYYKNMMKVNYLDPQFMDNKK